MHLLSQFIRAHEDEIVQRWLSEVSRLPSASGQSAALLRDHMPQLLARIADTLDAAGEPGGMRLHADNEAHEIADQHARERLREGFDLQQAVAEYRTLRRTILDLFRESGPISEESRPRLLPLAHLDEAIDLAIADSVGRYAVERDRARDTFVSILGHDLRNPLNAITMSATVLLNRADRLDDRSVRVAAQIAASAKRMEAIIADVLDFARGRLGSGIPVVRKPGDLRLVVATTVSELASAHPDRDIRCCGANGDGSFVGQWDMTRLAQAISNLVGNAINHGSDPIEVVACDCGDSVRIEVRNGGVIAPELLPTLFEPFTVRSQGTPRPAAGLGLGLYIVHEIVVAHGGQVTVDSDAARGTTVSLHLPKA